MSAHAAASPSTSAMWLVCPASITKAAGKTRPSSKYAREGTAAHQVAEGIIRGDPFPPEKVTVEGEEFIVGRNMLSDLNPYIAHIQALKDYNFNVLTEQRVSIGTSGGWVWGTADCIAWQQNVLEIVDLKFGKGVKVSLKSPQLKIYALGALELLSIFGVFKAVVTTIVQPRLDPVPQSEPFHADELREWKNTDLDPAIAKIMYGDETEVAGPHCRWCVRRDECSAYNSLRSGKAADAFDDKVVD